MLINNAIEFAQYLRDQRKKQGLSQAQAAEAVGLKQSTISDFENKPDGTKLDTLFRLLATTNLELHLQPKQSDPPRQQDFEDNAW